MKYTLSWDDGEWALLRIEDLEEAGRFPMAHEEIAVRLCSALNNGTIILKGEE